MHRMMVVPAVLVALAAGAASAKPALRDVRQIDEGLFTVGLAHEIRKKCPNIEARMFTAFGYLRGLERQARDLGYSDDEIRQHLDSKAEKQRLRARAAVYMKDQGFEQNEAGYCALGKAEIERNSEIGALLREK